MTLVVSVRFKDSGRTYYFDPADMEFRRGDMVIVETIHGPELARVVYENFDVAENDIVGELKPVLRRADHDDLEYTRTLQKHHDDVMARCNEKIQEHNLAMRLVKAEYNFDGSRLTFYFTADQRVDFRMLVRDLARTFKTRIELRQIGPRDEARLLGGIGICGRMLCCSTFLPNYARVSIKMAKDQDLPLNPTKISGLCGRLLCCLAYEHQQYTEMKTGMPRRGVWVQTPDGVGEVVEVNVLQQVVTVQLANSGMQEQYAVNLVKETTSRLHARQTGYTKKEDTASDRKKASEKTTFLDDDDEIDSSEILGLLDEDDMEFVDYDVEGNDKEQPSKPSPHTDKSHASQKPSRSAERAKPSQESGTRRPSSSRRPRKRPPPEQKKPSGTTTTQEQRSSGTSTQPSREKSTQPSSTTSKSSSRRRRRKRVRE